MRIMATVAVLTVVCGIAMAQDFSKVGTSSAQFLKFVVDARSASLGGAHSGIYGDVASLHWNPGGIAAVDRFSLALSFTDLYVGLRHTFLGVVVPVGGRSSVGVSAIMLDSGEMEQTTIEEPDGTGTRFRVRDYAFGLSYARSVTDWLMIGGTVRYIREELWHEAAQGVSFDIGSVLETGLLGIKLGMNLSNYGTDMKLDGEDLKFPYTTDRFTQERGAALVTESWPMPVAFRVGAAMDVVGGVTEFFPSDIHRFTLYVDYNEYNDAGSRGNFGVEYQWERALSARFGYYNNYDTAKLSYGLGLSFNFARRRFDFDYALVDFDRLDLVHQYTLTLRF